jgi:Ca2+-binding RTX toxin-like protein
VTPAPSLAAAALAPAAPDPIVVGTDPHMLTGTSGHDVFVFPTAADQGNIIANFTAGQDVLDLIGLMKSINYKGQDPLADHVLQLVQQGHDTAVVVDPHGAGGIAPHTVVTLTNVVASSLTDGHDFIWH